MNFNDMSYISHVEDAKDFSLALKPYYVYLLLDNGVVVYAGSTCHLASRVSSHEKSKDFNEVKVVKFNSESEAKISELQTIMHYKPFYNCAWQEASTFGMTSLVQFRNSFNPKPPTSAVKKSLRNVSMQFNYLGAIYFSFDEAKAELIKLTKKSWNIRGDK